MARIDDWIIIDVVVVVIVLITRIVYTSTTHQSTNQTTNWLLNSRLLHTRINIIVLCAMQIRDFHDRQRVVRV
jgi:hypothetical protein